MACVSNRRFCNFGRRKSSSGGRRYGPDRVLAFRSGFCFGYSVRHSFHGGEYPARENDPGKGVLPFVRNGGNRQRKVDLDLAKRVHRQPHAELRKVRRQIFRGYRCRSHVSHSAPRSMSAKHCTGPASLE